MYLKVLLPLFCSLYYKYSFNFYRCICAGLSIAQIQQDIIKKNVGILKVVHQSLKYFIKNKMHT